jgi:predicted glycosyltransferase involved in capsule biosynthesis
MFNSGRALNIGIRLVQTPYVITTDADILLSKDVISSAVKYLEKANCIVFCQRFDTTEKGMIEKLHNKSAIGTFIGMKTEWINKIHGIDEHFEGYGGWDNDMVDRAIADGVQPVWLNEVAPVLILHIWHEVREHVKMNENLMYLRKEKPVVRNLNGWGEL